MAFNLQKVLRALLFSSSQALSVKDVQEIFARFHEQAPAQPPETDDEISTLAVAVSPETPDDAVAADADAETDADAPAPEIEREPEPEPDPEAPSLKPAELLSAQSHDEVVAPSADEEGADDAENAQGGEPSEATDDAEVEALFPADTDAELYRGVPSLITAVQIREAMDAIAAELHASNDIYILVEGPAGYRLMTHPRYARWIRIMRDEPPPVKLSQSALETLAVVAYRQPVTRSEIESIRGVSAEAGLSKLMERELVYITGRADLPGRPLQYGTTDKFLEFVGVKTLVELPASDVLSPRQIDAWLQNSTKITPPSDAEMGLPLEEGEGESPNLAEVSVPQTGTQTPFETTTATDAASADPATAGPAATQEPPPPEQSAQPEPSDLPGQPDQPEPSGEADSADPEKND